ncbi:MAG: hypothetical protein AB7O56_13635 [Bauldia sp.]
MTFPTAAVLFLVWFVITPLSRFALWMWAKNLGWFLRLLAAHLLALVIMIVASVIALDTDERVGMIVLLAIAQAVFFTHDLLRFRGTPPPG